MAAGYGCAIGMLASLPVMAAGSASVRAVDLNRLLVDGQASCQAIVSALGRPNGSYQGGRFLAFKIAVKNDNFLPQDGHLWDGVRFSLIVSCDSSGVMQRHALIDVKSAAK